MKRVLLLCFVVLFAWAGAVVAQEEPVEQEMQGITHGQFAVLLLKAAAGYTDTLPDASGRVGSGQAVRNGTRGLAGR